MDARSLSDYVLEDSRYDRRVINHALNAYGLSFVRHVFFGLKNGRLKEGIHLGRVLDDILNFYESDEEEVLRIDRVLAKIEQRIPKPSLEELRYEELECERRMLSKDLCFVGRMSRRNEGLFDRLLDSYEKLIKKYQERFEE